MGEYIRKSDIEEVFDNANFGDRDNREVIQKGLLKVMASWGTGHTMHYILRELGLARGDVKSGKGELTHVGKRYLYFDLMENGVRKND